MKRIDIIIPYILGPDNGLELRFALRSIRKNFQHKNYRIIVVGAKPDWLTGVEHLPFDRVAHHKNRNFTDQLLKLYSALTTLNVSADFVWTYDDIYFTSPVTLEEIAQLKAVAGFDRYPRHLDSSGAGPNWKSTMALTMQTVLNEGGSNYNYETHLPRWFSKKKVLELIDQYNLLGQPMMISSLYYNLLFRDQQPLCLFDSNPGIRLMIRKLIDYPSLRKIMPRHKFTNNAPGSWAPVLQKVLQEMFPEKCKYEL
jgi:hypothetical protein